MTSILEYLHERVLLCDGGTGSLVQAMNLSVEKDFLGKENCTEALVLARPDVVRAIHTRYFEAGADCVESNTFGASPVTLAEFGWADRALEINRQAVALAREAAARFADDRPRFVLGAMGPGTKLPSLGHIDYDTLEAAYALQGEGLASGGADAFLIETCQDLLQIKAAVNGARMGCLRAGRDIPVFVQVTVETTGTLLVGTDIAAAATVMHSLGVPLIGINCATGPQEMAEHVRWLAENWPGMVSVQPNAGLPELVEGCARYPLRPADLALWHERFVCEDGVTLVGGCCGTTPQHIGAVDAMLKRIGAGRRPTPVRRSVHWVPAVASLYGAVPLRQENAFLSIGERCNANGSRQFRQYQEVGNWDGIMAMARSQVKEGSHALDICTAFVGRNERADMIETIARLRGAASAPLVIDSTETVVIEAALKLYGGKAILNSVHFEEGETAIAERLRLARRFGAAVVALTIDEAGMAKTAAEKLRIAHRLHDFAVHRHGLPPSDLLFDPLTFTICTGTLEDRRLAIETLEAIERLRAELPECQIVLGLSNVSFGLKPAARHVLNSVFLEHALRRGLTAAIVHVSRLLPLHRLPAEEVRAAEDLIFDRGSAVHDPLQAFIALFQDHTAEDTAAPVLPATVEERLKRRIVDGNRQGLEEDLAEAMRINSPLAIINDLLLDGMKEVGVLFGSGKMQLPFVLQSAETMKAAVASLEPFMERATAGQKGTLVLATVKGDVHDIGKNLVDIILTNNGYRVVNLGIKQPVAAIMAAARAHKADAVGMSGLLVKSTVIMRDNLEEMTREGFDIPVLLGGAALTRRFVEEDCVSAYGCGRVAYAKDAFAGLELMSTVVDGTFDSHIDARARPHPPRPERPRPEERPVDWEAVRLRRAELAAIATVPDPPFWGSRVMDRVSVKALLPYLNEVMLYQFQWGFRKAGKSREEWRAWAAAEVRPVLNRLLALCEAESLLEPRAVYGYWPCAAAGDSVILFDPHDAATEIARFTFPRQPRAEGVCLADFFRDGDQGGRDIIGVQVVTMGARASDGARAWLAADRYQDYLYLHGLSVEMTEALAEYVHKTIRAELGFAGEDAREIDAMLKQGYRGARYSFGYPACPALADQRVLLALLGAERIGVTLSEEDQLHPEQSTSAIVCIHPQAK
ncbi:MAG: 5-methyltetrahydrofolate--homocysteine methyltransferase [Rhodospirillaceae bacterium]|nr:MAG: 5-methyltetrahydrofolate--homocysteine methyltransferase [Rhodospirillaceae bacterium]